MYRSNTPATVDWNEIEDYNGYADEHLENEPREEVLADMPWFNADCTRQDAEALLTMARPSSFVVRPSSKPGSYALSMTDSSGKLIHAQIQRDGRGFFIAGAPDPYPTIAGRKFSMFVVVTFFC